MTRSRLFSTFFSFAFVFVPFDNGFDSSCSQLPPFVVIDFVQVKPRDSQIIISCIKAVLYVGPISSDTDLS